MEIISIDKLYADGELEFKDIKLIKDYFNFECVRCKERDIAIMIETDDDGYCETCSSPYASFTIKCKKCGNAISIRDR